MAPIKIKHVVSFSSQDSRHPVDNLLKGDSSRKWLSSAGDKCSQLEAVFQLEQACVITHIDIGTFWTFAVEVFVSRSSLNEFHSLIPTSTFMNVVDCKMGRNKVGMRMFTSENFNSKARDEMWDRVKIVCSQPYRKDVQFGLSVLKIMSASNNCKDVDASTKAQLLTDSKSNQLINSSPRLQKFGLSTSSPPVQKSSTQMDRLYFSEKQNSLSPKFSSTPLLSRANKLLQAAVEKAPKYKILDDTKIINDINVLESTKSKGDGIKVHDTVVVDGKSSQGRKHRVVKTDFENEVKKFIIRLDLKRLLKENENMQLVDLRHRMEKEKRRKLSKPERKIFIEMIKKALQDCVSDQEEETQKPTSDKVTADSNIGAKSRDSLSVNTSLTEENESQLNLNLSLDTFNDSLSGANTSFNNLSPCYDFNLDDSITIEDSNCTNVSKNTENFFDINDSHRDKDITDKKPVDFLLKKEHILTDNTRNINISNSGNENSKVKSSSINTEAAVIVESHAPITKQSSKLNSFDNDDDLFNSSTDSLSILLEAENIFSQISDNSSSILVKTSNNKSGRSSKKIDCLKSTKKAKSCVIDGSSLFSDSSGDEDLKIQLTCSMKSSTNDPSQNVKSPLHIPISPIVSHKNNTVVNKSYTRNTSPTCIIDLVDDNDENISDLDVQIIDSENCSALTPFKKLSSSLAVDTSKQISAFLPSGDVQEKTKLKGVKRKATSSPRLKNCSNSAIGTANNSPVSKHHSMLDGTVMLQSSSGSTQGLRVTQKSKKSRLSKKKVKLLDFKDSSDEEDKLVTFVL